MRSFSGRFVLLSLLLKNDPGYGQTHHTLGHTSCNNAGSILLLYSVRQNFSGQWIQHKGKLLFGNKITQKTGTTSKGEHNVSCQPLLFHLCYKQQITGYMKMSSWLSKGTYALQEMLTANHFYSQNFQYSLDWTVFVWNKTHPEKQKKKSAYLPDITKLLSFVTIHPTEASF